ncbi:hypothetical protein NIES4074_62180 (plasmid) [Cylindrospermum sp. NIES-4074]|nr:hypothetical protein NIES4074_62180 [Cylindrospermum sp. NIES-4074]
MPNSSPDNKKKQRITYKASMQGIEKATRTLQRLGFGSKKLFGESKGISRSTVTKFFQRQPIQLDSFKSICEALTLDWAEIVEITEEEKSERLEAEDWETITDFTVVKDITVLQNEIPRDNLAEEFTDRYHEWIGREKDLEALNELIRQGTKVVVIYGKGGVGKTTLAEHLFSTYGFTPPILEFRVAKESKQVDPVENIVDDWLQQIFKQKPGRNLRAKLDQLKHHLQRKKFCILVDNIESTLDQDGKFTENHRDFVELFRILNSKYVQSITLVTSREKICEPEIHYEGYRLEGLSYSSWKKFFGIRSVEINEPVLMEIHEAYGGNTKAMRIISANVCEFENNLNSYWEENSKELLQGELKNLVSTQFERLQKTDHEAYSLLCRLGFYRYQYIPRVERRGLLCLLWDVPEDRRMRAVISLRNRDLLDFHKGNYWLHPVIQAEATTRLRSEHEQKKIHQEIADFYFNSVYNSEDLAQVKSAFEAFYHFHKAQAFERCSETLLYKILGAEKTNYENLRCSVNIWNYTSRILELGKSILNNLASEERLLNLIPVGVCYSDLGKNFKALEISQEILDTADNLNSSTEEVIFAKTAAHSIAGRANRLIGKFQESLRSCEAATKTANSSKQPQTKALALYELGRAYLDLEKPGRALRCFVVAAFQAVGMKVAEEIYEFAGLLFVPMQDLSTRIEKVLSKYEPGDTASNNIKKFRILYSIAQCFNLMPLPLSPLAKIFASKALTIAEQADKSSTTWAYLELAIYYSRIDEKNYSKEFYQKAEVNLVGEDETFVIVTVLGRIAAWHYQQCRFLQALEKYRELEETLRETDFLYLKAYAYYGLSITYHQLESFTSAFQACDHALAIANELNLPLASKCQALKNKLLRGVT